MPSVSYLSTELDPYHDEEKIAKRFTTGQFPKTENSWMDHIIHKCWAGEYDSVNAVLTDLSMLPECPMKDR